MNMSGGEAFALVFVLAVVASVFVSLDWLQRRFLNKWWLRVVVALFVAYLVVGFAFAEVTKTPEARKAEEDARARQKSEQQKPRELTLAEGILGVIAYSGPLGDPYALNIISKYRDVDECSAALTKKNPLRTKVRADELGVGPANISVSLDCVTLKALIAQARAVKVSVIGYWDVANDKVVPLCVFVEGKEPSCKEVRP